jgi:hypothetical protein
VVSISGTNFYDGTSVSFGGTAAASFTVNSDSSITATTAAGTPGLVDVTVTTATGTSPKSAGDRFTYTAPPPRVTSLSPSTGSGNGGEAVTIGGTGFVSVLGVSFGGLPAKQFTVNSATSVTAVAPADGAGPVDIRVTTLSGTSPVDPAHDQFTYTTGTTAPPPLTMTQLSPQTSAEDAQVSLTISTADTNSNYAPLTFAIVGQPAGLTIDQNGKISGSVQQGAAATSGGIYTVTVSVSDAKGATASQLFAWFVTPTYQQPSITAPNSQTSAEGGTVSLALTSNDPEGNTLTFAASGLPGGLSIDPTTGLISGTVDYSAAEQQGANAPRSPGQFTVLVTATDGQGGRAATSFRWTIQETPRAPTMADPGSTSSAEGQSIALQVVASSPDLRTLTYTATGLPGGLSIDPHSGLISGTLGYTDAEGHSGAEASGGSNPPVSGQYTVNVTATDDRSLSTSQTYIWSVSDTPRAPVVTNPGSQSNQEGDIVDLAVVAADLDGDTLSFSASGLPSGLGIDSTTGAITGTIGYSAGTDQAGRYSVTVTASAPTGVSSRQTFTWVVAAVTGPLSITNPGSQTSAEGAAVSLQTQVADPDGNDFTRTATGLPAGLTMNADGLITGTVSYSAAEASGGSNPPVAGSYSVTLSATDTAGQTDSKIFTWSITDTYRPPVIGQVANQSNHEGDAVSFTIAATAPEGDPYTFSATGLPAGVAINANSGLISGTLAYSDGETQGGSYSVTVLATDSLGNVGSQSFGWSVADTDRAPTLTNPGSQANVEADQVSLPLSSVDLDGNTLSFSATGLPGGLSINSSTGAITGQLDYNDAEKSAGIQPAAGGQYFVTVNVSDGHGGQATQSFDWSISDAARPTQVSAEGQVISYLVQPEFPGGRTLTYSATGLPGGLAINSSTGLITGTVAYGDAQASGGREPPVPGAYVVTVTATDSQGNAVNESFGWIVTHTDEPPSVTNPGAQSNIEGYNVNLPIVASDAEGNSITFAATGLPAGLSIDVNSGVINGTIDFTDAEQGADAPRSPGLFNITVTVTDSLGVSSSQTFAWQAVHTTQPPAIVSPGAQTNAEGDTVSLALTGSNLDNDTLQFLATGLPGGLSLNSSTGVISGQLDYNDAELGTTQPGTYQITVAAFDGYGEVGTQQFSWTVTDAQRPTRTDAEGATVGLLVLPENPQGKDLTYSAIGLPGGLSIDSISGQISGTLDYGDAEASGGCQPNVVPIPGNFQVIVTATDFQGNATSETFHWVITDTPRPPAVTNPWVESNQEGDYVSLPVQATSPDGRTLWFSAANLPTGLSIDPVSGLVSGTVSYQAAENNAGPYNVTVTANDDRGLATSVNFVWAVIDVPRPPVVTYPGIQTNAEGDVVNLAVAATDPDGETLSYSAVGLPGGLSIDWNTGAISGTIDNSAAEQGTANNGQAAIPGVYQVIVTASDPEGRSDSQTFNWSVADTIRPLVITSPGAQSSAEGANVLLPILSSDPDADSVTFSALNLPDGLSIEPNSGAIIGTISPGDATASGGTGYPQSGSAPVPGEYTVTVSALDNLGRTATMSFAWTVAHTYQQPTIQDPGAQSNAEGDSVSLQLSVDDPENNPLTFSATGLPAGLSIDSATGLISGKVAYTAAEASAGSNPPVPGQYSVTVTAVDNQSGAASLVLNWTITHVQQPLSIANVVPPTIVEGSSVSLGVSASGPDPSSWRFSAVGLPSGLSINATTGVISGTLSATGAEDNLPSGQSSDGNYPVQVTATNNLAQTGSTSFVWTVTSTGTTPVITNPGPQMRKENDVVSLPLVISNPGGYALSFSATGLPIGLSIDSASGTISGTIASNASQGSSATDPNTSAPIPGQFFVTVKADDGAGHSTSQTFTWNVEHTPLAPTITAPANQTNAEGDSVSLAVIASDPAGDSLNYAADGLPAGVTIDPGSGLISGTLYYSDAEESSDPSQPAGTYLVTVTAFNSSSLSATASFTWTVTDTAQAPVVEQPQTQNDGEGDTPWLRILAVSPEGRDVTFSATGLPTGLSIDATSGLISGTLDYADAENSTLGNAAGQYAVIATATDSQGLATSKQFTWDVADTQGPPVIDTPGLQHNFEGDVVSLAISAAAPSQTALTYSAVGLPSGLTIDANTGVISGTIDYAAAEAGNVPGIYTTTVTATDANSASSAVSFTWAVLDTPRPPVVTNPGDQTNAEGDTVSLAISATDPDGYPMQFGATGLPVGLRIDADTGIISGSVAYLDSQNLDGSYPVEVVAVDGHGPATTIDFTWTVTQTVLPPVFAAPLAQSNAEGDSVWLSVAARDPMARPITYSAIGLPAGATINPVTGLISGTIDYTDAEQGTGNSGQGIVAGQYTVSVTAANDQGGANTQSFLWTVADTYRAPAMSHVPHQHNLEGDNVAVSLTVCDPESSVPVFSAAGLPAGVSINAASGAITGTLAFGDAQASYPEPSGDGAVVPGSYRVTVTASDLDSQGNVLGSASQTFDWIVEPGTRPPVVTSPGNLTNAEGDNVSLAISASDPAGNAFIFKATGLPTGLSIDPFTGVISGTVSYSAAEASPLTTPPLTNSPRVYTVTVSADDGLGAVGNQTFAWTINHTPTTPVITNPGAQTSEAGATVALAISACDPAGQSMTYSASGLPAGLAIDPNSGVISGTIDSAAAQTSSGSYNIIVTAVDALGETASQGFAWTITNSDSAPTAGALAVTTLLNSAVTFQLLGQDVGDDVLTYQVSTQPSHGTVVLTPGPQGSTLAVFTPAAGYTGLDSFGYETSDGQLTSAEGTVSLTVAALPVAGNASFQAAPLTTPPLTTAPSGLTWTDEMAAHAVTLSLPVGTAFGNGAVFISVPGMPTPTTLAGLVNGGAGDAAGVTPMSGSFSSSFAGSFTENSSGTSLTDTTSGSNSVKYFVETSTDSAGDAILDESITSSFTIGVNSKRADGTGNDLAESSTFNYVLHEVNAGSTVTYTLTESGSNSFGEILQPLTTTTTINDTARTAGSGSTGNSANSMQTGETTNDSNSDTYSATDTMSVTTNADGTKSLTDSFTDSTTQTDTYDDSSSMSANVAPATNGPPSGASNTNSDSFSDTWTFSGSDTRYDKVSDSLSTSSNAQETGTEGDQQFESGSDQYSEQQGSSETTGNSASYPVLSAGGNGASGSYSDVTSSTVATTDTVSGSDNYSDSSDDTETLGSGISDSKNSSMRGNGSDTYSDSETDTSGTAYTAPGATGSTSDVLNLFDSGSDRYQFSASDDSTDSSGTTTDAAGDTLSGSGNDQYSGTDDQASNSQSTSSGGGTNQTSYSHASVSGSDEYDDAGSGSQNTTTDGTLVESQTGNSADQVDGDGSDQYSGSGGSTSHDVVKTPGGAETVTTDDVSSGSVSGGDQYDFAAGDSSAENANGTTTDNQTDTVDGSGNDRYQANDRSGYVDASSGAAGSTTVSDAGTAAVSGSDQYQFTAGDDSADNGTGSHTDDARDAIKASGNDQFTLGDVWTDDSNSGTAVSGKTMSTIGGLSVPSQIAGGGAFQSVNDTTDSTLSGSDQYTLDETDDDAHSGTAESKNDHSKGDVNGSAEYTSDEQDATTSGSVSSFGATVGSMAWGLPAAGSPSGSVVVSLGSDESLADVSGGGEYDTKETDADTRSPGADENTDVVDRTQADGNDSYTLGGLNTNQFLSETFGSQPGWQSFGGSRSGMLNAGLFSGQDQFQGNGSEDDKTDVTTGGIADSETDTEAGKGGDTYTDVSYNGRAALTAGLSIASGAGGNASISDGTNLSNSWQVLGVVDGGDKYNDAGGGDGTDTGGAPWVTHDFNNLLGTGNDTFTVAGLQSDSSGGNQSASGTPAVSSNDSSGQVTNAADLATGNAQYNLVDAGTDNADPTNPVASTDNAVILVKGTATITTTGLQTDDTSDTSATSDQEVHDRAASQVTAADKGAAMEADGQTIYANTSKLDNDVSMSVDTGQLILALGYAERDVNDASPNYGTENERESTAVISAVQIGFAVTRCGFSNQQPNGTSSGASGAASKVGASEVDMGQDVRISDDNSSSPLGNVTIDTGRQALSGTSGTANSTACVFSGYSTAGTFYVTADSGSGNQQSSIGSIVSQLYGSGSPLSSGTGGMVCGTGSSGFRQQNVTVTGSESGTGNDSSISKAPASGQQTSANYSGSGGPSALQTASHSKSGETDWGTTSQGAYFNMTRSSDAATLLAGLAVGMKSSGQSSASPASASSGASQSSSDNASDWTKFNDAGTGQQGVLQVSIFQGVGPSAVTSATVETTTAASTEQDQSASGDASGDSMSVTSPSPGSTGSSGPSPGTSNQQQATALWGNDQVNTTGGVNDAVSLYVQSGGAILLGSEQRTSSATGQAVSKWDQTMQAAPSGSAGGCLFSDQSDLVKTADKYAETAGSTLVDQESGGSTSALPGKFISLLKAAQQSFICGTDHADLKDVSNLNPQWNKSDSRSDEGRGQGFRACGWLAASATTALTVGPYSSNGNWTAKLRVGNDGLELADSLNDVSAKSGSGGTSSAAKSTNIDDLLSKYFDNQQNADATWTTSPNGTYNGHSFTATQIRGGQSDDTVNLVDGFDHTQHSTSLGIHHRDGTTAPASTFLHDDTAWGTSDYTGDGSLTDNMSYLFQLLGYDSDERTKSHDHFTNPIQWWDDKKTHEDAIDEGGGTNANGPQPATGGTLKYLDANATTADETETLQGTDSWQGYDPSVGYRAGGSSTCAQVNSKEQLGTGSSNDEKTDVGSQSLGVKLATGQQDGSPYTPDPAAKVKWNTQEVIEFLKAMGATDVAEFLSSKAKYLSPIERAPFEGSWFFGLFPSQSASATFDGKNRIQVLVPDGWTSAQVAAYIAERVGDPNPISNDLSKAFSYFLSLNGKNEEWMARRLKALNAFGKALAEVLKTGADIVISIAPGGDVVISAKDASNGNYAIAVLGLLPILGGVLAKKLAVAVASKLPAVQFGKHAITFTPEAAALIAKLSQKNRLYRLSNG